MEKNDTFKIGTREFQFLGLTFKGSLVFEQRVNAKRAVLLFKDGKQELPEAALTVDGSFIENYFSDEDWHEIFSVALKCLNPEWVDRFDEKGDKIGKYNTWFFSSDDFSMLDIETAEAIKKNLLSSLDCVKIQNKPLNLQVKLYSNLLTALQKNQRDV